jgi:predicted lipoprotein
MPSFQPRRIFAALIVAATFALVGCTTDSGTDYPTVSAGYGYDTVLAAVGPNVILATYADLSVKGTALQNAAIALNANPTEGNLHAARQAWRDARAPWERGEGFLFGPVADKGIDPSIDSWPLDSTTLKRVLTTDTTSLNVVYVNGQANEVKGFHAMEYLLFGIDSSKTAASLTTRERQYLVAAAAHFKNRVDTLKLSWAADGQNFLAQFTTAGSGSTRYTSAHAAAEDLVEGMIGICDEVANGKITEPYNEGTRAEESRFSRNSTTDFANNIRSVRNVYLGIYGSATTGKGVKVWVLAADTALAVRVESEIDSAIFKTEAVGNFSEALQTSAGKAKIVIARSAIQKLKTTLEGRVKHAVLDQ